MSSKGKEQPKKAASKKSAAKVRAAKAPAKKAVAGKATAGKAAAGKGRTSVEVQQMVSPEDRRQLIAEAAFRRAEERHFQESDPVGDWLAAEREIDRKLESSARI